MRTIENTMSYVSMTGVRYKQQVVNNLNTILKAQQATYNYY